MITAFPLNPYLSEEEARDIVRNFVLRAVVPLMECGDVKRKLIAITVYAIREGEEPRMTRPLVRLFINLTNADPERPFDKFADAKADLSGRTKKTTREVLSMDPNQLRTGDCLYPGGIYFCGFAVGVSAFNDWDDEAIAWQIAVELWRYSMRKHMTQIQSGEPYLLP